MSKAKADVLVTDEGTVVTFDLWSKAAFDFVRNNFATESWQWLGNRRLVIDHRFAAGAIEHLRDGGLTVEAR